MDFSKILGKATDYGQAIWNQTAETLGAGVGFAQAALGRTFLFGSTENSSSYANDKRDEKHYLLIPDHRQEAKYSLYVLRLLPEGVPPINDLPKHRLFHLPDEHAMPTVEAILLEQARDEAGEEAAPAGNTRLHDLANQIDQLDGKVFNGVLVIGGLVALINPIAGAAIAAKALIPSLGLTLSKYGLRYAGDSYEEKDLEKQVRNAEKEVLSQFRESGTSSLVNPLLRQLDQALATDEYEFDPVMEFDRESLDFPEEDRDRFFKLTCTAISNAYEDVVDRPEKHAEADLGPEDIRFLNLLRELAKDRKNA